MCADLVWSGLWLGKGPGSAQSPRVMIQLALPSVPSAPAPASFLTSLPFTSPSTGGPSEGPAGLSHFEDLLRDQEWDLGERSHQEGARPCPAATDPAGASLSPDPHLSALQTCSQGLLTGPRGQGGRVGSTQHPIWADWDLSSAFITPFLEPLEKPLHLSFHFLLSCNMG